LTADRAVDTGSLRRLIDRQLKAGVSGIFVLGSTGEVALLPDRLRRIVVETAVDQVNGRVPVLAGAIDTATLRVGEHITDAAAAGANAAVVTAPFYTRTHPAEIEEHFRRLADRSQLPIFAYDLPVSVGSKLSADLLVRLARDGVIVGVKDSSGDDAGLRQLVLAAREAGLQNLSVLTGSELTVDAALAFGADGCVPGLGNVDPDGYVRLYEACRAQRWDDARHEQARLIELFSLTDVAADRMGGGSAALGAFKAALKLRGIIDCAATAPPYLPLNENDTAHIADQLQVAGLL
jgi:4-hydroxy-tetrahydrodipicolinate synthase